MLERLWIGILTTTIALSCRAVFADCSYTNAGLTPLTDMTPKDTYAARGGGPLTVTVGGRLLTSPFEGGLYPGGELRPPPAHLAAALTLGKEIVPRLADGTPGDSGLIGVLAIGLSNTTQMFSKPPSAPGLPGCTPPGSVNNPCPPPPWMPSIVRTTTFKALADADPARKRELVFVDGALGGADAGAWATWASDPTNVNAANPWRHAATELALATPTPVTEAQVQVAWIKLALLSPHTASYGAAAGNFPDHASILRDRLVVIVRTLKQLYPNIKLAYLSSRMRGFTHDTGGNREPWAYESAFGVKWLIADQIADEDEAGSPAFDAGLRYSSGDAPLLLWGPYFWADGLRARSDGRIAVCSPANPFSPGNEFLSDVRAYDDRDPATDPQGTMYDYTHPGGGGIKKNADQLWAFFRANVTSSGWFLRPLTPAPSFVVSADARGRAPLTIAFAAEGALATYTWDYDDGTQSIGAAPPPKTFATPGSYRVRLAAADAAGNNVVRTVSVEVTSDDGQASAPPTEKEVVTPTDAPTDVPTEPDTPTESVTPTESEPSAPSVEPSPSRRISGCASSSSCAGWPLLLVALVSRASLRRRICAVKRMG